MANQGMLPMQGEDPFSMGASSRRSLSPDPQKKKRKLDPVRKEILKGLLDVSQKCD